MMRAAAGQDRSGEDIDDFVRDMGGRMIIKVHSCSHCAVSSQARNAVTNPP